MRVSDLGEFSLIDRLAQQVAEAGSAQLGATRGPTMLTIGIGDDAAAWTVAAPTTEVLTTDTLVQGVHFTPKTTGWHDLGWKALAVNLSDIAAMGGVPRFAVVTLGLPGDAAVDDMDDLYRGMLEACAEYAVGIVGGDVVASQTVFVTVALTGVTPGPVMERSSARPGDFVGVTGALGGSAAGLALLQGRESAGPDDTAALQAAHRRPVPRLAEGQALLAGGVTCAMDVSDGLVADLGRLCRASGLAARVRADRVPVHPAALRAFGEGSLAMALGGGEDYELLFTATSAVLSRVLDRLPCGGTLIGEITDGPAGQVTVEDQAGRALDVGTGGWDHFEL